MDVRERRLLDKIASAIESLLLGESSQKIDASAENCSEEVRKVCEAVNFAERLRHKIQMHPFSVVNALTCSFGVALFRTEESEDAFVKRADEALYEAKKKGKNRVEVAKD
jgi:GGDEF domain-containing protein